MKNSKSVKFHKHPCISPIISNHLNKHGAPKSKLVNMWYNLKGQKEETNRDTKEFNQKNPFRTCQNKDNKDKHSIIPTIQKECWLMMNNQNNHEVSS